jgi:hypothetical protein
MMTAGCRGEWRLGSVSHPVHGGAAYLLRSRRSHAPQVTGHIVLRRCRLSGRKGWSAVVEAWRDHDAQRLGCQGNAGRGVGADLTVDVKGKGRVGV